MWIEKSLCAVGSMGHNGVISQSLYTKESDDSERTYQNHFPVFTLLSSFGQVFEPMGYNTFTVSFKVFSDERRLVVSAV